MPLPWPVHSRRGAGFGELAIWKGPASRAKLVQLRSLQQVLREESRGGNAPTEPATRKNRRGACHATFEKIGSRLCGRTRQARASFIAAGNLDLVLQSEVEAPSRKEPCPGAVLSPKRKAREDRRPATRQNTPPHPWQLTDRGVRGVGDTSGRFCTGTNYKCSWRKESGWFRAIGAA